MFLLWECFAKKSDRYAHSLEQGLCKKICRIKKGRLEATGCQSVWTIPLRSLTLCINIQDAITRACSVATTAQERWYLASVQYLAIEWYLTINWHLAINWYLTIELYLAINWYSAINWYLANDTYLAISWYLIIRLYLAIRWYLECYLWSVDTGYSWPNIRIFGQKCPKQKSCGLAATSWLYNCIVRSHTLVFSLKTSIGPLLDCIPVYLGFQHQSTESIFPCNGNVSNKFYLHLAFSIIFAMKWS